jgi:hypothetical protein
VVGGAQSRTLVVPNHRPQFATLESMAPTANKRAAADKQQTRLNFKNVRKNASASLKPSKPTLVTAAASKATTKSKVDKKWATEASDVSSIEPDEHELEEVSDPEGTEPGFESVRYAASLSHKLWLILPLKATFNAN